MSRVVSLITRCRLCGGRVFQEGFRKIKSCPCGGTTLTPLREAEWEMLNLHRRFGETKDPVDKRRFDEAYDRWYQLKIIRGET